MFGIDDLGIGALVMRCLVPAIEWLSTIRWGQVIASTAPYLFALGVSIPWSQFGVSVLGDSLGIFSDQFDKMSDAPLIMPQNFITVINTFIPLGAVVSVLNILGACWVSHAVSKAWGGVADRVARSSGKGVAF